jgi:hypothetical protein
MMPTRRFQLLILLATFAGGALLINAQPRNLLQNPNGDQAAEFWRAFGEATVEQVTGNNLCFVVRNGGYFIQDVPVPDDAAGQYAVLIGRGSSQRIHEGGAITGLPYLYGYMMDKAGPRGGHVLEYLQGQRMRAKTKIRDEWVDMWGIFQVPEKTKVIRFFLSQASRSGVPHNGSAARFDNLGLYLFATKEDAEAFVSGYH